MYEYVEQDKFVDLYLYFCIIFYSLQGENNKQAQVITGSYVQNLADFRWVFLESLALGGKQLLDTTCRSRCHW